MIKELINNLHQWSEKVLEAEYHLRSLWDSGKENELLTFYYELPIEILTSPPILDLFLVFLRISEDTEVLENIDGEIILKCLLTAIKTNPTALENYLELYHFYDAFFDDEVKAKKVKKKAKKVIKRFKKGLK